MLRTGTLRHVLTLQTNTPTQDASGALIESWANTQTGIAANVQTTGGGETIRGRQVAPTTTHLVTIHYRTGVVPTQRFLWGSVYLNITRAEDPDGMRQKLEVQCEQAK